MYGKYSYRKTLDRHVYHDSLIRAMTHSGEKFYIHVKLYTGCKTKDNRYSPGYHDDQKSGNGCKKIDLMWCLPPYLSLMGN